MNDGEGAERGTQLFRVLTGLSNVNSIPMDVIEVKVGEMLLKLMLSVTSLTLHGKTQNICIYFKTQYFFYSW